MQIKLRLGNKKSPVAIYWPKIKFLFSSLNITAIFLPQVHIKSLSISKREELIRRGLTDRNDSVRAVVAKSLVPAWLRFCNENIVELLYALDVGNSDGSTAKEVLSVLFKDVPYEELVNAFQVGMCKFRTFWI